MQRIQNEELETELVRYKLLCVLAYVPKSLVNTSSRYAELVQHSESESHRLSVLSRRSQTST